MANPTTIAKIKSLNADGAEVTTANGKSFIVNSFSPETGILTLTAPMGSMTIYEFANIIVACFSSHSSTFKNVRCVTFTFNTITVTVSFGEAFCNPGYVVRKWKKAWDADLEVKDKVEKLYPYLNEDIDS